MSLRPQFIDDEIPELTEQIAQAAFPKGNRYMKMRDELGSIYDDELFEDLYPAKGQPAAAPWQLALVTVMQFAENLTDRQAADAVRGRIDWKYALGLELTDAGFNYSVLSEFRDRLLAGEAEGRLLERMLALFKERELLNKDEQRTDATHILAAVRNLNRLEIVGETLRNTLNILAQVDGDWLCQQIDEAWFARYSQPLTDFRLPKPKQEREAFALVIGNDGKKLLKQLYLGSAPAYLRELPAVEVLRQVWVQQFCQNGAELEWRKQSNFPPSGVMVASPYDVDSRYSQKRGMEWRGYKVHLTETCSDKAPNLITQVTTTDASVQEATVIMDIQTQLHEQDLSPDVLLVDMAYVSSDHLVDSQLDYETELLGPARPPADWQSRQSDAYDQQRFAIDWENQTVTCPQGKQNRYWKPASGPRGKPTIQVIFEKSDCLACSSRGLCTRSKSSPRQLTLHPRPQHEALMNRRAYQESASFKQRYKKRAGVEGTISQAAFSFGMRRTRYRGLAKTHLQHLATASAINVCRVVSWLGGVPRAQTRSSHFGRLKASFA